MDSEEEKLERRFSSTRDPVRGRVKWGQTGEKSSTQSSRSSAKNGRPWSVSCDLVLTSTPPSYLYATLNPIPFIKKIWKAYFMPYCSFFFLINPFMVIAAQLFCRANWSTWMKDLFYLLHLIIFKFKRCKTISICPAKE